MKVKKESDNCVSIEIERGHTHTLFHSGTEEENQPFKEVHITWSDFPEDHNGIHVDTFDDGSIYIGIPKNLNMKIRLGSQPDT